MIRMGVNRESASLPVRYTYSKDFHDAFRLYSGMCVCVCLGPSDYQISQCILTALATADKQSKVFPLVNLDKSNKQVKRLFVLALEPK